MLRSEWWEGFLKRVKGVMETEIRKGMAVSSIPPEIPYECTVAYDALADILNKHEAEVRADTWQFVMSGLSEALKLHKRIDPCPKLPNNVV